MRLMGILLTSLLVLSSVSADEPKKIALLVGVSDYQSLSIDDLKFAENDIRVVGSQLKLMGFDVTSLSGKKATRKQTITTIDSFMEKASQLESNDIVLVMFSGHGQQIRVSEKTPSGSRVAEVPYFCPVDALPFDESKFSTRGKSENQVAQQLNFVSLNRVLRGLDESSNSLNNLLVVDACRNNPSKGKAAGVSGTSATVPSGVNIIFAAGSGQKSWESADKKIKHGVFTHFLIKGLQGDAKNRRDQVTWSRLASYLQDEVAFSGPDLAGNKSRQQNPHSIINSTNLIVLGKATSDEVIEKRLYQSLRQPSDVLDIAEMCQEKNFVITPVYLAMLMGSDEDFIRGREILEPHADSLELISLVLNLGEDLDARSESHQQLFALPQLIALGLSEKGDSLLSLPLENQSATLFDFAFKLPLFSAKVSSLTTYEQVAALDEHQERMQEKWKEISKEVEEKFEEPIIKLFQKYLSDMESMGEAARKRIELAEQRKQMIGKPFPAISGKDLGGNAISTEDFKGKILIIDAWAFW